MVQLLNNRYKPQKMLGHGGMGKVYLMIDTHTQQRVAVKECFVSPSTVERIKREYYFMTKIEHKHLVRGLDFFAHKDRYFIVMEYVEGITLHEFLRKHSQSIPLKEQLRIAAQICDAVAALNENGIIHRDIKPENIILSSSKLVPKLLDFGIAKAVNGELATITKTSNIIGTPAYMTPEQIDSRIEMCGNLDVFSLGIVFYQFLSWMPHSPFCAGQIVSTLDRIVNSELPPLFATAKEPQKKYISQVIAWALRKNPQQRIESVQVLQHLLCHQDEQKILEAVNSVKQTSRIQNNLLKPQKYSRFAYARILCWLVLGMTIVYGLLSSQITQPQPQLQLQSPRSSSNYTQELRFFVARNKHLWSRCERGILLYRMREKIADYKGEAMRIWRKEVKDPKDSDDVVRSAYQLLYVEMLDIITASSWREASIKRLQQNCMKNIQILQGVPEKSSMQMKILRNCLEFQDILQTISKWKKIKNKSSIGGQRKFFDKQKLHGGYQSLFLAFQVTERLSNQMKLLHQALKMIPDEELVYSELIKVYSQVEFYEEAEATYDYLRENINPHLLSADIEILSAFLAQGEMNKAKEIFDKLVTYEIFQSNWVQILYCQYLFLLDNNEAARIIIKKLGDEKSFSLREKSLKAVIERGLDEQPRGNQNILLQTAELYILKNDSALAKKYINYVEEHIKLKKTRRMKANLQRVKLKLYDNELQRKQINFSFSKYRNIAVVDDVRGYRDQFVTLLAVVRFAIRHHLRLGEYRSLLEEHCDADTFFRIYGEYCFQQQKYLDAIGYWENAIQQQPIFRDYLTKKQYDAWQKLGE